MSSRIRENSRFFEVIVEARRGDCSGDLSFVELHFVHPQVHQDVLNSITKFVFPFDEYFNSSTVDCFTFVLTDGDGIFKFGFCRLSANSRICHCLVSYYPWFDLFYRLLNQFVESKKTHTIAHLIAWIDSLLVIRCFRPGEVITSGNLDLAFSFEVPDPCQLMTIPANINLTEYFCAVDAKNMLEIFASTLLERRIVVTSKRLSRLTACVHSAATLLSPFQWQHIFIPILPPHLLDYCSAPMPFLIGVHSSLWNKIRKEDLGDVLILDADDNSIYSPFNDVNKLPPLVVRKLKKLLGISSKKKPCFEGCYIPQAFLQALVLLFGGYRSAFKTENQKIVFDNDAFVESRPTSYQSFLRYSLQLQIFQQFIEERLVSLNANKVISDVFEEEIRAMESKRMWKGDNLKLDQKFSKMIKKAEKSRFANFLENFMGGCSSNLDKEPNLGSKVPKSQTPNFSKKFFPKMPRKMSENFVSSLSREFKDSKKQLSSSNSSDGLIRHHQSLTSEELKLDRVAGGFHEGRNKGTIRDAINWSEPVSSSSSYETLNMASQESLNNLHGNHNVLKNKISQSFGDIQNDKERNVPHISDEVVSNAKLETGESNLLEASVLKVSKTGKARLGVKKVHQLIKLYEDNDTNKDLTSKTSSSNSTFPGIYFPPHHPPSSIAARQADLQASTEQWKKNYMSRNVAQISFGLSNVNSKFPVTSFVRETSISVGHQGPLKSTNNIPIKKSPSDALCSQQISQHSELSGKGSCSESLALIGESPSTDDHSRMPVANQLSHGSRGLSSFGLSRRSAFKVNKSQSSTESQRDSVLQSLRKSLKDSLEITVKKEQNSFPSAGSFSDGDYSTPPLPSSSPPIDDNSNDANFFEHHLPPGHKMSRVSNNVDQKCLTLCMTDFNWTNQRYSDDNVSLTSAASSYSSFASPECNGDTKHFTLPTNSLSSLKGIYAPMLFRKGKSKDS